MSDPIPHNEAQPIPVIPARARVVKPITVARFEDGDIVELPSHELVRYQHAQPGPTDRIWHFHPQTANGLGDFVEHLPDGKGWMKACLWEHADRSIDDIEDMVTWRTTDPEAWRGGLVAPAGASVAVMIQIDDGSGDILHLCGTCYSRGPDGDGYDPDDGIVTTHDKGCCEVCCCEYLVSDNRYVELPDGTLEHDELVDKVETLEAKLREYAIPSPTELHAAPIEAGFDVDDEDESEDAYAARRSELIVARVVDAAAAWYQADPTDEGAIEAAEHELDAAVAAHLEAAGIETPAPKDDDNPRWRDDRTQFARLLCEIVATQDKLDLAVVAASMDLELGDVQSLLDRADRTWETAKATTTTAAAGVEDADGHDHAFDRLFLARLVVALGMPTTDTQLERVANALAIEPEAVGEFFAFAEQVVRGDETAKVPSVVKCPRCGTTDPDQLSIKETFTAYHPIEGFRGGTFGLRNALGEPSPSEHFDDGQSDYKVHCNACAHTGSPGAFGIPDSDEWEWC